MKKYTALPTWLLTNMAAFLWLSPAHPWWHRYFTLDEWARHRTGLCKLFDFDFWLIILAALIFLSGCTPFVEVGAHYSDDAGWVEFDETGLAGTWAVGVEFEDRWYLPSECGRYHRSMADSRPEIVTNDIGCKKRIRFGQEK